MTLGTTVPAGDGESAASMAHSRISVMFGYVRVATAGSWADARVLLRAHLDAVHSHFARTERGDESYERECGRIALNRVEGGFLFTSAPGTFFDATRYAREGLHGITPGDLVIVQDYSNRYNFWTIAVKAKVLSVGPLEAIVRITGDSSQFTRGETRSIPLSFLRPRKPKGK
jgi:hypothetical protein